MKSYPFSQQHALLFEALYSGKGLQHIVDTASAILQNPVLIADISNKVLAKTPGYDFYGVSVFADNEPAFLGESIVRMSQRAKLPQQLRQAEGRPLIVDAENGKRYCLSLIRVNSNIVAHLAVCQEKTTLTQEIIPIVEMLTKVTMLELQKGNNNLLAGFASSRLFLLDLLEKRLTSQGSIQLRLDDLGWHPKSDFCLFIIPNVGDSSNQLILQNTISYLQLLIPRSLYAITQVGIVLLYTMERNEGLANVDMRMLNDYLMDCDLICGISNVFYDLRDVADIYLQTFSLLNVGRKMRSGEHIFCYEDLSPYLLLDTCNRKFDLHTFCMPTMRLLQDYDRTHKTPLMPTLKIFMDTGMDYSKTAVELFIHRNSLGYRIDKIKSILNIPEFTGPIIQEIQLTLRIFEYLDTYCQ